jgi:syntaxin 5
MTQRIDENIEETLSNVDSAKAQLMKYLSSISSNRMLMMKVFVVLMAFLAIFVLFVA